MKIAILATVLALSATPAFAAGTCPPKSNPHVFVHGSCVGDVTIARSVPTSRSVATSRSAPTTVQLAAMQRRRHHQGVNPAAVMAIPLAVIAASAHQQRHRPRYHHSYAPRYYQQPMYTHRGYGGVYRSEFGTERRSGYHREMYSREQLRMTTTRQRVESPRPRGTPADIETAKTLYKNF